MKAIILMMFLATFLVRFFPLLFFNRIAIPDRLKEWLHFVPMAIFAGLIGQILFEPLVYFPNWIGQMPLFVSSAATILLAIKTRSLAISMSIGWVLFIAVTKLLDFLAPPIW